MGHHRRHLSSPRLAERHPQTSRDLGAHADPLDLAYAELQQAGALSVEAAWAHMNYTSYARQTRAAWTLGLVKALRMAHNEAADPVFWPNSGGRVGGKQPGETAA